MGERKHKQIIATLEVEFTAGSTLEDCGKEATNLAGRLGVAIEFNFNGCICTCYPEGSWENLVAMYKEFIKGPNNTSTGFVNNL